MKLDPQTLINLKISEAVKILFEHNCSFGYTYQKNRAEEKSTQLNSYRLLLDKDGVVIQARIG